ncbi:zinc finger MYND domain-containing protein [Phanerochaete sordida]|uniref:Zinc finger MYND domain-containing protein n=1 Tax=Phanerochaete sordida TaxID=48140 RepID=A0A9P3FZC1_9APHY|nr:zinc finger MYND domain-containing protein [Phanerochaete sordida]
MSTTSRKIDVEAKDIRHIFIKCKVCAKDRDAAGKKLSLCAGCQGTTYCGTACQKQDWPAHKASCLARREVLREEARLDEIVLAGAKNPSAVVLPTQIYADMRAFKIKFMAAIFQMTFNALNLRAKPDAWQANIVVTTLKRVRDPRPPAKSWQRYTIHAIEVMTRQRWATLTGEGMNYHLTQQAYERDLFLRGDKVGVIAYALRTPCMGLSVPWLHVNSTVGYEADSEETLNIEDAWEKTFRDTVERMCGRMAPLAITCPDEEQPAGSDSHGSNIEDSSDNL